MDLFAKVGAARIDAEGGGGALARVNDKATNFAYGWGVQWRWNSLAVRAEYERFDTDLIGDLNLASLGVTYTLPGAALNEVSGRSPQSPWRLRAFCCVSFVTVFIHHPVL